MPRDARLLTLAAAGVDVRPGQDKIFSDAAGKSSRYARFTMTDLAPIGADVDGSITHLEGLAVPWGVPTSRFGVPVVFTAATTHLPDDLSTVKLLVQHDDERPVGYALSALSSDDGLRMSFAVDTSHPRAAELVDDVDRKWRDGLSVGIELADSTFDAILARLFGDDDDDSPIPFEGTVREVSAVSVPQFNGARVGAAVSPLVRFESEEPAVPENTSGVATVDALSIEELAAQLAPHLAPASPVHPLSAFGSFADFVLAVREGTADVDREFFALVDQITTNNPGVIPPNWLTTIVGIIDRGRPTVQAFGGARSAGDSGMSIDWPYYDGGYAGLVGVQATEKTEVTTRRVDIKRATADLATYAGASDISYQLLRRSSPSYREAYARILAIAYGVTTDAVFAAAVTAAAAGSGTWDGSTLASLTAALFAASATVDNATGAPADVVLAAPDVFATIGVLDGLKPPAYGTNNVQGTSQASTLRVNVSGLEVVNDRSLAAGTLLVASSEAAQWREDGPFPIEADDVPKLGRDVGIWGMGASTVQIPEAIVAVTVTPPAPDALSTSSRTSK